MLSFGLKLFPLHSLDLLELQRWYFSNDNSQPTRTRCSLDSRLLMQALVNIPTLIAMVIRSLRFNYLLVTWAIF